MNKAEYKKRQKAITALAIRSERRAAGRIRALLKQAVREFWESYKQGSLMRAVYPKEKLLPQIQQIIIEEGERPVKAQKKLQADYEKDIAKELDLPPDAIASTDAAADAAAGAGADALSAWKNRQRERLIARLKASALAKPAIASGALSSGALSSATRNAKLHPSPYSLTPRLADRNPPPP